jgi:hypothetical protein
MASYILRVRPIVVAWMTLLRLSMAASWADSAVVDDGASSVVGTASKINSGGTRESARVAATEDRGEGMLAFRQVGENFFCTVEKQCRRWIAHCPPSGVAALRSPSLRKPEVGFMPRESAL